MRKLIKSLAFLISISCVRSAWATSSAELYTAESYGYGRFEARMMFAPGDGVVSAMFLWKNGSETSGAYWNELDYEKIGADCRVQTNAIYGKPSTNHDQRLTQAIDFCGGFHTYAYEWTPDAIAWFVDGVEVRRETGATAKAYADNASSDGMTLHLNVWPGDESFGGNFSPAILPVHQYIDWVQYSAYQAGAFSVSWREDFNGTTLPAGMLAATWASDKKKSTHTPKNVNFVSGYAVLSLTADNATGPAGAKLPDGGTTSGADGSAPDGMAAVSDASSGASDAGRGDADGRSSDASSDGADSSATGAGGAAGAGNTGTGGAAGAGNTATDGAAGAGNTTTGGAAGAGNTATGGAAGAGNSGTGGAAGAGNSGTGGAGSNAVGKDSGAAGATSAAGGTNNAAGASNAPAPSSEGGCSVAPGKAQSTLLAPFAVLALALLGRGARRRERRNLGLGRSA